MTERGHESSRGDAVRLAEMQAALRAIMRFTEGGRAEFVTSELIQAAVIRKLEVVGEAAGRVSDGLRKDNSDVKWTKLRGFASFSKHEYWRVDLDLLWKAVEEIPSLDRMISRIHARFPAE
ncbi:MAG: DUF86 domain-containing protein [Thermoplasmata archaeon]|nr:DUF86 domain-containing protein [Thermoplasmata archaeon]